MLGFIVAIVALQSQVGDYAIGSVIVAAISGAVSWLTVRSSNRAAIQSAATTAHADTESARAQAETQAYERARRMLSSTIDELEEQLANERQQRRTEVDALNRELERERHDRLEEQERCRTEMGALRDRVAAQAALIRRLRPGDDDPTI